MKVCKRISLFFIYPMLMAGIGFLCGTLCIKYFYPGQGEQAEENNSMIVQEEQQLMGSDLKTEKLLEESIGSDKQDRDSSGNTVIKTEEPGTATARAERAAKQSNAAQSDAIQGNDSQISSAQISAQNDETDKVSDIKSQLDKFAEEDVEPVSAFMEKLTADTDYVLEEVDVRNQTVVETIWNLPAMYIGMNREQFLAAMDLYESAPPLAELERGFVSLEVLAFSAKRVIVQMNYEYTQPSNSFYIKAENNLLVVYLDDQETVYMYTNILLDMLPERVQQDIINVMFIPDEESLYDFLENYSS